MRPINLGLMTLITGSFWFLLVRFYYSIKPVVPMRVRLSLRRWLAKQKRELCASVWPILELAGACPEGWPGWPDGRQFALVLTHDVELQTGLDRSRQLAELEMSLGFRSSFNFIPEGPYRVSEELRSWLTDHGFEVGVHDHRHDGKLYRSQSSFRASAERINHFLQSWNSKSGYMLGGNSDDVTSGVFRLSGHAAASSCG